MCMTCHSNKTIRQIIQDSQTIPVRWYILNTKQPKTIIYNVLYMLHQTFISLLYAMIHKYETYSSIKYKHLHYRNGICVTFYSIWTMFSTSYAKMCSNHELNIYEAQCITSLNELFVFYFESCSMYNIQILLTFPQFVP
jgi:hypothetical protein